MKDDEKNRDGHPQRLHRVSSWEVISLASLKNKQDRQLCFFFFFLHNYVAVQAGLTCSSWTHNLLKSSSLFGASADPLQAIGLCKRQSKLS